MRQTVVITNREMPVDVAEAIVEYAKDTKRFGPDTAERLIYTWLLNRGFRVDRWGNFKDPQDPDRRYKITKQRLQLQSKVGGRWSNVRTYNKQNAALSLVEQAAARTGSEDAVAHLSKKKATRKKAKTKRKQAADEERRLKLAHIEARRRLSFSHPGLVMLALSGDAEAQRTVLRWSKQEAAMIASSDVPSSKIVHGWASAELPPLFALASWMGRVDVSDTLPYEWKQVQGGRHYTVWIKSIEPGKAAVSIGKPRAAAVHPLTHRLGAFGPTRAVGDAYASGYVELEDDGTVSAVLFFVMAEERRMGAGSRVLELWCRLMAGYGVDVWVAQSVGEEGLPFLEALAEAGTIELIAKRGADLLVRCTFGQMPLFGHSYGV